MSYSINYHIFCCNLFVFACPIIAESPCLLFALRANMDICTQLPVSAQWCQQLYVKEQRNKGNNKITELRAILKKQREIQNS